MCGFSSSGRAPPCQGGGSEFEPRRPLHKKEKRVLSKALFSNIRRHSQVVRQRTANPRLPQFKSGWRLHVGVHSARLEKSNREGGCFFLICAPWLLLSKSNPLCWASILFFSGKKRYTRSVKSKRFFRQGLFCKGGIYPHQINPDCGSFAAK